MPHDLDVSIYHYDDKGDRILKYVNGSEEIRYVTPYYVVRQGSIGSKHIFAGKQRIAVKMSNDSYEDNQYYFHPDHLGSSSFMTNATGEVFEHIEYFPFGETWADEHSDNKNVPYKFTGKELDEETGLYYYGARYYDPRTSVWQSPDPILEKYMDGKGNSGGVFNPANLGVFSYTHNNPVNFIDPDGRELAQVILDTPESQKYISLDNNPRAQRGIIVDKKFAPQTKKLLNTLIKKKIYVRINIMSRCSNPPSANMPPARHQALYS